MTRSNIQVTSDLLHQIHASITSCERCPRLRDYCRGIGEAKRRAYQDQTYWARPVPGFGDPLARILILGLAPGAHGANRTGRPFTGDGSGDFMYPVLHELGLATKPRAIARDDGLKLRYAWIASVVRCAPPGDKPIPQEIRNCASHLAQEIQALPRIRVVVCLGKIAFDGYLAYLLHTGIITRKSDYRFAHGAEYVLPKAASTVPCLPGSFSGPGNSLVYLSRIFSSCLESFLVGNTVGCRKCGTEYHRHKSNRDQNVFQVSPQPQL